MNITPELMLQILVTVATGAGLYARISIDIAKLSERVQALRENVLSHERRLDRMRDGGA